MIALEAVDHLIELKIKVEQYNVENLTALLAVRSSNTDAEALEEAQEKLNKYKIQYPDLFI